MKPITGRHTRYGTEISCSYLYQAGFRSFKGDFVFEAFLLIVLILGKARNGQRRFLRGARFLPSPNFKGTTRTSQSSRFE